MIKPDMAWGITTILLLLDTVIEAIKE